MSSFNDGITFHSAIIPFEKLELNSEIKDLFVGINTMWRLLGYKVNAVSFFEPTSYVLGDFVGLNIEKPFFEISYFADYREYVFLLHIEQGEIQYSSHFAWERWLEDGEQKDCHIILNCKEDIERAITKMVELVEEYEI